MPDRWTQETQTLIAERLHAEHCNDPGCLARTNEDRDAAIALATLADAGLLVQPGATTRLSDRPQSTIVHLPLSADASNLPQTGEVSDRTTDDPRPYPSRGRTRNEIERIVVAWTQLHGGDLLHRSVLIRELQAVVDATVTNAAEAAYEHGKRSADKR